MVAERRQATRGLRQEVLGSSPVAEKTERSAIGQMAWRAKKSSLPPLGRAPRHPASYPQFIFALAPGPALHGQKKLGMILAGNRLPSAFMRDSDHGDPTGRTLLELKAPWVAERGSASSHRLPRGSLPRVHWTLTS